jgi:hypothetical protein
MLKWALSNPSLCRTVIMKGCWILSKILACIFWDDHVIFYSIYVLYLLICMCWTVLCIPGKKPVWSEYDFF